MKNLLKVSIIFLVVACLPYAQCDTTDDIQHANLKNAAKNGLYELDLKYSNFQKSILDPDRKSRRRRGLIKHLFQRWPNAVVYYRIENDNFSQSEINVIQNAMKSIEDVSCVRFKNIGNNPPRNFNHVKIFKGEGCYSYIGLINMGAQELSLGKGCLHHGVVTHELLHALGFFHEQSRPDRDNYVEILRSNILPGFEKQFKINQNIDSRGSPYDESSVMHYAADLFSKNGKPTIRSRRNRKLGNIKLAQSDIDQLNLFYECVKPTKQPSTSTTRKHSTKTTLKPKTSTVIKTTTISSQSSKSPVKTTKAPLETTISPKTTKATSSSPKSTTRKTTSTLSESTTRKTTSTSSTSTTRKTTSTSSTSTTRKTTSTSSTSTTPKTTSTSSKSTVPKTMSPSSRSTTSKPTSPSFKSTTKETTATSTQQATTRKTTSFSSTVSSTKITKQPTTTRKSTSRQTSRTTSTVMATKFTKQPTITQKSTSPKTPDTSTVVFTKQPFKTTRLTTHSSTSTSNTETAPLISTKQSTGQTTPLQSTTAATAKKSQTPNTESTRVKEMTTKYSTKTTATIPTETSKPTSKKNNTLSPITTSSTTSEIFSTLTTMKVKTTLKASTYSTTKGKPESTLENSNTTLTPSINATTPTFTTAETIKTKPTATNAKKQCFGKINWFKECSFYVKKLPEICSNYYLRFLCDLSCCALLN